MEFVVQKVVYKSVSRSGYTYCIMKVIEKGTDNVSTLCGEITDKNIDARDILTVREPKREYNPKYSQYEYKTNFLMDLHYPPDPKHALVKMTKSMRIKPALAKKLVHEHPGDPWKCIHQNHKPVSMDDHDWLDGVLNKVDAFKGISDEFDEKKNKTLTSVLKWFEEKGLNWGKPLVESIIVAYVGTNSQQEQVFDPNVSDAVLHTIKTHPLRLRHVIGIGLAKLKQFVSILELTDEKKREMEAIFCIYDRQAMQGHIYFKPKEIPEIKNPKAFPDVIHVDKKTGWFCLVEQREQERTIATILNEFNGEVDDDGVVDPVEEHSQNIPAELSPEQVTAYTNALEHNVSCITGVPGGGKSYVIGTICRTWLKDYDDCNVVLLAPTGRAVYRLKEMREHFDVCERRTHCMTIHKFVHSGVKCIQDMQVHPLFVVIDECSMVDTHTFNITLKFIKQQSVDSLLLVGDTNQLPPVGYGDVFRNILDSKKFKTVCLNKVYRQASGESALKQAILSVKEKLVPQVIPGDPSYERIVCDCDIAQKVIEVIGRYHHTDFERQDVILLASTNKTVNHYQMKVANSINPNRHKFATVQNETEMPRFVKGDVVRHIKNVYLTEGDEESAQQTVLLNGTPGVIVAYDESTHDFQVNFLDRQIGHYNSHDRNRGNLNVDLGYIGTVHKSQGSEAKVVILVVETYKCLVHNWSLLYTAITRAKEKCIIIGPNDVFVHMVSTLATKRRTTLHEHFSES